MIKNRISIYLFFAHIIFGTATAMASSLITASPETAYSPAKITSGQIHTLAVNCPSQSSMTVISRLAVLEQTHSGKTYDYGITTAHGLVDVNGTPLKGCYILDFNGGKFPVKYITVAKNYAPGSITDWAVVSFKRLENPSIVRYALTGPMEAPFYENLAEQHLAVRFSSARGIPDDRQKCQLYPRRYAGLTNSRFIGLIPHDCRAVRGQSGTPVSIVRNGQHIVLGMHMGSLLTLGTDYTTKAKTHGFMRVFDDSLRAELSIAITRSDTLVKKVAP